MLAKEGEEEEEGQTSRGSPVIGKCLHWQLYSEHFFIYFFYVDFLHRGICQ